MYARPRAQLGGAPVRVLDPVPSELRYRVVANGHHEGPVPAGDPGTFFTLALMRELARADAPLLVEVADRIIGTTGNPLARIRAFLSERVRFTHDPAGVELLKAPAYQLASIRSRGSTAGDCDDVAILGAALGLAAGYPARFVVLRFEPEGPYEHVYAELRGPHGWFELDTTRQQQRVPASFKPAARATFDVGAPDDVLKIGVRMQRRGLPAGF